MQITATETLLECTKFKLARNHLRSKSGTEFAREFFIHPGAVVLVPMIEPSRIVMVRNYRHTLDRRLLELPAGTLEPGEAYESAAVRELAEETGYTAKKLTRLLEFFPSPGICNERMAIYLAQELTKGAQALEADEDMSVEIVELGAALAMIDDGRIVDGKTMIGLWRLASKGPR